MKKIYITTFQNADNYGAMLQCYALSTFLKKKYKTFVINYDNEIISNQYKVIRKLDKNPLKSIYHYLIDIINYNDSKSRKNNFNHFRTIISFTNLIKSFDELKYGNSDVFVTGSDQVWNPKITGKLDDIYFLNIKNDNCKKISYAASCGDVSTLLEDSNEFKKMINSFDSVSVRESGLSDYINKNTPIKSSVVLDPTLLITKRDWCELIKSRLIKDKYIFVYSVGNANGLFYKSVEKLSNETGLKIVFFDKKDLSNKYKINKERWYKAGPLEFLNLLYYSEYVITTSFHGFALSLIFNKNIFLVLSTYPDRILTLVDSLELKNRIVNNENDIVDMLKNNINWNKINKILDEKRLLSQKWLIDSIDK